MKILFYDCFSGISGDMNLAAMIGLGVEPDYLRAELSKLGLDHAFELKVSSDSRKGIHGVRVDVVLKGSDGGAHSHEARADERGHCHGHAEASTMERDQDHAHAHGHDHEHAHDHDHAQDHEYAHEHAHGHVHCHDHEHDREHAHDHEHDRDYAHEHTHEHDHAHCHAHVHDHGHEHSHAHGHAHDRHDHAHGHAHGHGDAPSQVGGGEARHGDHAHRNLRDIEAIIAASSLADEVKKTSLAIFRKVAEAEALVHGKELYEVHFHEVGAIDSIVDIVGAAICRHRLDVDEVWSSPIELGGGFSRCCHGLMPSPAPATVEILKGIPTTRGAVRAETATPTGAAILATLADRFEERPRLTVEKTAYGIGHRDTEIPNVLRVHLAQANT